jgi:hypothetical protein
MEEETIPFRRHVATGPRTCNFEGFVQHHLRY